MEKCYGRRTDQMEKEKPIQILKEEKIEQQPEEVAGKKENPFSKKEDLTQIKQENYRIINEEQRRRIMEKCYGRITDQMEKEKPMQISKEEKIEQQLEEMAEQQKDNSFSEKEHLTQMQQENDTIINEEQMTEELITEINSILKENKNGNIVAKEIIQYLLDKEESLKTSEEGKQVLQRGFQRAISEAFKNNKFKLLFFWLDQQSEPQSWIKENLKGIMSSDQKQFLSFFEDSKRAIKGLAKLPSTLSPKRPRININQDAKKKIEHILKVELERVENNEFQPENSDILKGPIQIDSSSYNLHEPFYTRCKEKGIYETFRQKIKDAGDAKMICDIFLYAKSYQEMKQESKYFFEENTALFVEVFRQIQKSEKADVVKDHAITAMIVGIGIDGFWKVFLGKSLSMEEQEILLENAVVEQLDGIFMRPESRGGVAGKIKFFEEIQSRKNAVEDFFAKRKKQIEHQISCVGDKEERGKKLKAALKKVEMLEKNITRLREQDSSTIQSDNMIEKIYGNQLWKKMEKGKNECEQKYKENDKLKKLQEGHQLSWKLFEKYQDRIHYAKLNFSGEIMSYDCFSKGININLSKILEEIDTSGIKSVFHEIGHFIDYQMGKKPESMVFDSGKLYDDAYKDFLKILAEVKFSQINMEDIFSSLIEASEQFLRENSDVDIDFKSILLVYTKGLKEDIAKKILQEIILKEGLAKTFQEITELADILENIMYGKIVPRNILSENDFSKDDKFIKYLQKENWRVGERLFRGHGSEYWDRERHCCTEIFAEMFSATLCNWKSAEQIVRFFPEAYDTFLEIVKELLKKDLPAE